MKLNLKEKLCYTAPEVEIVGQQIQSILCASGGTEQYGGGSSAGWFAIDGDTEQYGLGSTGGWFF